ncbi:hypothetical protein JZU68_06035 [bacterium]|jgi:hypothetical protein|nr:hypothetical protein [bacterium]
MKTMKFFTVIGMLLVSFLLSAQVPTATQTQVPVAPKVIKKLPEKQQAMYDQMATDLQLTEEQKAKAIELAIERAVSLNEKMKAATTDEQKKELRKESGVEYNKKLDDAFGVELSGKLKTWQREYTLKQKAAQAK